MDFKAVLSMLIKKFEKSNTHYALMGGFALGLWGVGRATVDIDFLISRKDMEMADRIMLETGYKRKYRSDNVSQYVSPLQVFGEVDFLHAFREASLEMLERAEEKEIFNGLLKIKVLKPEDLIGLKLQAIKNDPERMENDMADVKALIAVYEKKLDWSLIERYFQLFDMKDEYDKLLKEKGR